MLADQSISGYNNCSVTLPKAALKVGQLASAGDNFVQRLWDRGVHLKSDSSLRTRRYGLNPILACRMLSYSYRTAWHGIALQSIDNWFGYARVVQAVFCLMLGDRMSLLNLL